MELIKGMMKVPSDVKPSDIQRELKAVLTRNEKVEKAYLLPQSIFVFTDKRLIIQDAAAATDETAPCHSIPYRSITHFGMAPMQESASEVQLSIWLHGDAMPIRKELERSPIVSELHCTLADYVLNKHSPWMNKQLSWKKKSCFSTAKAFGFTGAAVLSVMCFKRMHKKHRIPVPSIASPASAIAALLRKAIKG